MSANLPLNDTNAAGAARSARQEHLRTVIGLAQQFGDDLQSVDQLHAVGCFPAGDAALNGVQDDIHRLESALQQGLCDVMSQRNAALSPFYRLHDDIVRRIFHFACVGVDGQTLHFSWGGRTNIVLSHVSRYWRTIALSMPELWATARFLFEAREHVRIARRDRTPWDTTAHALSEMVPCSSPPSRRSIFLQRSRGWTLTASLNLLGGSGSEVSEPFLDACSGRPLCLAVLLGARSTFALLNCLTAVSRNLKELDIQLRTVTDDRLHPINLQTLLRLPMPSLRRLVLQWSVWLYPEFVFQPTFTGTSDLLVLELELCQMNETFTLSTYRSMLLCCPNIHSLSISADLGRPYLLLYMVPTNRDAHQVTMSHLTSYTVSLDLRQSAIAFDALLAPQITHLDLCLGMPCVGHLDPTSRAAQDMCGQSLLAFLTNSSPTSGLQSLSVNGLQPLSCVQALRMSPTIEHLRYNAWTFATPPGQDWDALLQEAMPSRNLANPNNVLFPSLQSLVYDGKYGRRARFHQLLSERLSPPFPHVKRLRRLALDERLMWSEDIMLQEAALAGLVEEFYIGKWKYDVASGGWLDHGMKRGRRPDEWNE